MRDLGTVDVCVAVAVARVLIVMVGGAPATTQHATVAAPEHIEHIGGYPGGHVRLRRHLCLCVRVWDWARLGCGGSSLSTLVKPGSVSLDKMEISREVVIQLTADSWGLILSYCGLLWSTDVLSPEISCRWEMIDGSESELLLAVAPIHAMFLPWILIVGKMLTEFLSPFLFLSSPFTG